MSLVSPVTHLDHSPVQLVARMREERMGGRPHEAEAEAEERQWNALMEAQADLPKQDGQGTQSSSPSQESATRQQTSNNEMHYRSEHRAQENVQALAKARRRCNDATSQEEGQA